MIISMCKNHNFLKDTIVITNRKLVQGDLLTQLQKVTALSPYAVILREKDLSDEEYEELARKVMELCKKQKVFCFIHSRFELAGKLHCRAIHVSVSALPELQKYRQDFDQISVSCHSLEDVQKAIQSGATQIILGTIFETECKKGLKGRGLEFVQQISQYCKQHGNVPIYAIGGITPENMPAVKAAGAKGGCMMSYLMKL